MKLLVLNILLAMAVLIVGGCSSNKAAPAKSAPRAALELPAEEGPGMA